MAEAYTTAMAAAQLMERVVAIVVTASDLDALDQLAPQEIDERFHAAFTRKTAGNLGKKIPVADEGSLRERVAQAWKERNRLAHRFFLDNLAALLDPEACDQLGEELSDFADLFGGVADQVMELGYALAEERGVTGEDLELFGRMAQLAMMRDPATFEQLDLWGPADGAEFVRRVARSFGFDPASIEEE